MIFAGMVGVVVVIGLIGVTWLALATEPRHRRASRSSVAQRVAEGVARLDAAVPGWWERVDVNRLEISSPSQCVLGQVFGSYVHGLVVLGLHELSEIQECGLLNEDDDRDEILLRREWVDLIKDRQVERQIKEQYV